MEGLGQQIFTNELIMANILQYLPGKDLLSFRAVSQNILRICMGSNIYSKLAIRFKDEIGLNAFCQIILTENFNFNKITVVKFDPTINLGDKCDAFFSLYSKNLKILEGTLEAHALFQNLHNFAQLLKKYNWDKIEEIYLRMELSFVFTRRGCDFGGWKDVPFMPWVKKVHISCACVREPDEDYEDLTVFYLIQGQFPNAVVNLSQFKSSNGPGFKILYK